MEKLICVLHNHLKQVCECFPLSEWSIRWSIWAWRRTSEWGVLATPTAEFLGSSSTGKWLPPLFNNNKKTKHGICSGRKNYTHTHTPIPTLWFYYWNKPHQTATSDTPFWLKSRGRRGEEMKNKESFICWGRSTWTRISSSWDGLRSSLRHQSR